MDRLVCEVNFTFIKTASRHSAEFSWIQWQAWRYVPGSISYFYPYTLRSCHSQCVLSIHTENGSTFMAVYTIRLLMWRMMDNSWVIWPRQRFPWIALTPQYKWQQKCSQGCVCVCVRGQGVMCGGWGVICGRGRPLQDFYLGKMSMKWKQLRKQIKWTAVIPTFVLNRQRWLRRAKLSRTWCWGRGLQA